VTNDVYEELVEDIGQRFYRWSDNFWTETAWVEAVRKIWPPEAVLALCREGLSEIEIKMFILRKHMHQLPRGNNP
jgi:hypothetical protein